jgi:flagellar protein FlgJ
MDAARPLIGNDAGALDQRLSFDVQSVDALRRTARQSPQEGLRQASKQFEVLFMGMLLKSMREATPSEGLFGSPSEKTYTAMLDQQLAQKMSGRGLGLAEAMYAQLSKTLAPDAVAPPVQRLPTPAPLSVSSPRAPEVSAYEKMYESATAQASWSRSPLPQAHVENFVARLLPAAQRASLASGVPVQLIMAQAALESGWGRREIKGEGGQTTFNLFGIKADKSWKGPVAQATTTEHVHGKAEQTQASFRAYGSYDEAFADYARFLTRNPRYAGVRSAPDAAQAAHGLQRAGYASDPDYGHKLVRIMKQL